jgi:DNA-binding NarL/FixJ family response regulator
VAGDAALAQTWALSIRNYGDVTTANSAREALSARHRASDWAAFVVDVTLPDGSGLRVLEELRDDRRHVPALVLTGSLEPEHVNAAYRLNARYLVKPASVADIECFARSIPLAYRLEAVVRGWADRYKLSPAEADILVGAAIGQDRESIAIRRKSSVATVKSQIAKLLEKTGDKGLLEAANRLLRDLP